MPRNRKKYLGIGVVSYFNDLAVRGFLVQGVEVMKVKDE